MRSAKMLSVVGCHAGGEIGDVIVGGVLPPHGATMFEKMQTMQRDHDHIRRMLICEPRGSVARHINLILPSTRPDCDVGYIIMEPTEYPPMSGSNTICTVTVLLETGMLPMVEPVSTIRLDAPGGVVVAQAFCEHGRVKAVELENVPCFAHTLGARLDVSGFGQLEVDVAYGGMFYAIANAADLGLELVPKNARAICEIGEKIRLAAREQLNIIHPENPEILGVSIVHVCNPLTQAHDVVRGATVIAPGRLDRSPTGTALSARLAVLHAKGSLQVGQGYTQESVIGSRFDGRIVRQTQVGHVSAIVPSVRGRAWITGTHQYLLDPEDPFAHGFVLSDTWGLGGGVTQS